MKALGSVVALVSHNNDRAHQPSQGNGQQLVATARNVILYGSHDHPGGWGSPGPSNNPRRNGLPLTIKVGG